MHKQLKCLTLLTLNKSRYGSLLKVHGPPARCARKLKSLGEVPWAHQLWRHVTQQVVFFCIAMHCINYVHLLCAFVNMCKCSMRIYPSHGPFSLGLEDMQKLYEEWLSASECWSSSTYVIQLQQTSKFIKMGARRWMTFSQICEKYKSEDVATCIIEEKKKIQC